jgi:hypothetical protein
MPPCPTAPPPALALAPPWELPGWWAFWLGFAVFLYIMLRRLYRKAARPFTRRTQVGFILAIGGAACVVAGIGVLWLVLVPYVGHVVAWGELPQLTTIAGHPCRSDAGALETRLLVAEVSWNQWVASCVSFGLACGGLGASLIRPALYRSQVAPSDA